MFYSSTQAARAALAGIEVDLSTAPKQSTTVRRIARWFRGPKHAPHVEPALETTESGSLGKERIEQLVELARPGARLVPSGDQSTQNRTRLGGLPLLAVGTSWPTRSANQTTPGPTRPGHDSRPPLPFIGQFDFAELNGGGEMPELPTQGLLSLFYDALAYPDNLNEENRQCMHIIWEPEPESLQLASEFPRELSSQPGGAFPQQALRAEHGVFLPDGDDCDYGRLQLEDPFDVEYSEWQAEESFTSLSIDHRLGGRMNTIQFEGRRQDPVTGERTVPLLQLDSDAGSEMLWGDGGRLYLWIWPLDLAAGRLHRAELDVQSC